MALVIVQRTFHAYKFYNFRNNSVHTGRHDLTKRKDRNVFNGLVYCAFKVKLRAYTPNAESPVHSWICLAIIWDSTISNNVFAALVWPNEQIKPPNAMHNSKTHLQMYASVYVSFEMSKETDKKKVIHKTVSFMSNNAMLSYVLRFSDIFAFHVFAYVLFLTFEETIKKWWPSKSHVWNHSRRQFSINETRFPNRYENSFVFSF